MSQLSTSHGQVSAVSKKMVRRRWRTVRFLAPALGSAALLLGSARPASAACRPGFPSASGNVQQNIAPPVRTGNGPSLCDTIDEKINLPSSGQTYQWGSASGWAGGPVIDDDFRTCKFKGGKGAGSADAVYWKCTAASNVSSFAAYTREPGGGMSETDVSASQCLAGGELNSPFPTGSDEWHIHIHTDINDVCSPTTWNGEVQVHVK